MTGALSGATVILNGIKEHEPEVGLGREEDVRDFAKNVARVVDHRR